jgi:tRNA modification GTPase
MTCFPSKNLLLLPSHTLHVGNLVRHGNIIDEVVVSLFKAPRSYTGENVVEISCHGSAFIQQKIIDACIEKRCKACKAR